MTDEARIRLLSGVRVSLLVLSEIRLAMRDGRDTDPVAMRESAEWASRNLRHLVLEGRLRRRLRLSYR